MIEFRILEEPGQCRDPVKNGMSRDFCEPEFGETVPYLDSPCTPRELYRALQNVEEHIHYVEPAFRFVVAALDRQDLPPTKAENPESFVTELIDWANADLSREPLAGHARSWPARVAVEFAPTGLTDGAWLHGGVRANVVENEVGMLLLRQLMLRFGGPDTSESYGGRYASLLRSVGVAPGAISRWERDEASPCAEISFEHALLGLSLGLFPTCLGAETLGFNLWMSSIGPCPLLSRLADRLRSDGASLAYLDLQNREALSDLAIQTVLAFFRAEERALYRRVACGFAAAHRSYRRWEAAMLGRNVPMTPRQCVRAIIRRKALFARGHHTGVRLGSETIEDLFRGGEAAHDLLLSQLAASEFVIPGAPGQSRLVTHSISIDGPMFNVFSHSEQEDLREWIEGLAIETAPPPGEPVALQGNYIAPRDPQLLLQWAMNRYGALTLADLHFRLVNADQYPAVRLVARVLAETFLHALEVAFESDPRLTATPPPTWSERAISEMVSELHEKNVRSRRNNHASTPRPPYEKPPIAMAFDGIWLQGFADVRGADHEEYGWLFRIYASEQGEGRLDWNHNYIARKVFAGYGASTMLPATDRRLYDSCSIRPRDVLMTALSVNTRHFMPEILGSNLGIEASGVGGSYLDGWKANIGEGGNKWAALSSRLHNTVDNYDNGHTKWSLAAVQSYMARVEGATPGAVQREWHRIWRLFRLHEILEHGSEEERNALEQSQGVST